MANQKDFQSNEEDLNKISNDKDVLRYRFYEAIKNSGEILSAEDLDVLIESLKLARLNIRAQEQNRHKASKTEELSRIKEENIKREMEEKQMRQKKIVAVIVLIIIILSLRTFFR